VYRYTYHWDSFEAILTTSLMYLVLSPKRNSFLFRDSVTFRGNT